MQKVDRTMDDSNEVVELIVVDDEQPVVAESSEQVDENAITRWLHNQKFKSIFSKTFIKAWASGYKWEKTPQTPANLAVANQTLKELAAYYTFMMNKDAKKIQAASGGGLLGWFKGFFTKLFQRIKGNPGKMDALVKFNQSMGRQVKGLSDSLNGMLVKAEQAAKQGKSIDDGEGGETKKPPKKQKKAAESILGEEDKKPDETTPPKEGGDNGEMTPDNSPDAATSTNADNPDGEQEPNPDADKNTNLKIDEKDAEAAIKAFIANYEALIGACKDKSNKATLKDIMDDLFASQNVNNKADFIDTYKTNLTKADNASEVLENINKANAVFTNALKDPTHTNNLTQVIFNRTQPGNPYTVDSLCTAINEGETAGEIENGVSNAEGDASEEGEEGEVGEEEPSGIAAVFAQATKAQPAQIQWTNKTSFTASLGDIYIAEDSLYKAVIFLDGFITMVSSGKWMDDQGNTQELNVQGMLSGPIGTNYTNLENLTTQISQAIQKSSAFGSLQESTVKEFEKEFKMVAEADLDAMKAKKANKVNKALESLRRAMGLEEPKKPEVVTEAAVAPATEDFVKKDELVVEFDDCCDCKTDAEKALCRLRDAAFDGIEQPLDEAVVDEKEEDVVLEAPGDPGEEDPAAAAAAPAAPAPAAPAPAAPAAPAADPAAAAEPAPEDGPPAADAPMDISDLGAPPMDPASAPDAPPADAGADPGMAGAPPADPGADPAAAGAPPPDAGAAPADPNAAPAEPTDVNAAGEAPNAAGTENGEVGDKFDIGVTKPVNDTSDEVSLTDEEQEQFFTKINLLSKVPDLVNYGKYLYNITPENMDLDDIHYVNTLYELSVKLGLLVDEFENNNLLKKYDTYGYSVLTKNPEKQLSDAGETQGNTVLTEKTKKVKTDSGLEVLVTDAPGMIMADDVDDYLKQKEENEKDEEQNPDSTREDFSQEGISGLGSIVTFSAVLFGYPVIKSFYVKKKGNESAKNRALEELTKQGYKDIEILSTEDVDPVEMLYREYTGMQRIEDAYTERYVRNLLKESVDVGNKIPGEMEKDVEKAIDLLNKEIMEDPEIDYSKEVGVPKIFVTKEDFEKCLDKQQVAEDGESDGKCCIFTVKESSPGNLPKLLFSANCIKVCKCFEGLAATCNLTLGAVTNGTDTIELTLKR